MIVIVHVAPFGHVCLSLGGGETPPPFANVVISGYVQFDRWGGGERTGRSMQGWVAWEGSRQKFTRTETLTTKNKRLEEKAKTNSKELASVTTRLAETDGWGKIVEGREERKGERRKDKAVVRCFHLFLSLSDDVPFHVSPPTALLLLRLHLIQ